MTILSTLSQCFDNIKATIFNKPSYPSSLPVEVLEIIFSHLKFPELRQLSLSSKGWQQLIQLKFTHVIDLIKTCQKSTLMEAYKVSGYATLYLSCQWQENKILLGEKLFNLKPDFYVKVQVRVINDSMDDEACAQGIKTFFCSGRCVDYACTELKQILSVTFRGDLLNARQQRQVWAICHAMELYLNYKDKIYRKKRVTVKKNYLDD